MRIFKILASFVLLVLLTACTFQSDAVLPNVDAAGDAIVGFSSDTPTRLEGLDREKNTFTYIGTLTPQKVGGKVRYVFAFEEDEDKQLLLQAKKLSEGNYVVRYAEVAKGAAPKIEESALLFLRIDHGNYYFLMTLSDRKLLEKIYAGGKAPVEVGSSVIRFDDEAQVARLSAYFRDHFDEFAGTEDYAPVRIAR